MLFCGYTEFGRESEPSRIIQAPLDTHILLNSGPGTGKTYTILQRLIYILSHNLCQAEEIYILCYTRSAKQVIESKMEEAITQGTLSPSASNVCILTFDSYAAYFLRAMQEQGVITEDFSGYGYNERISLFNQHIAPEDLEFVRYFIADEIQDLVNERAEMVLQLLHHLSCGFLLAGDRCQSIYDYEANHGPTLNSVQFYQQLEAQFPADIQRYEILGNRRQSRELAEESEQMRRVLLEEDFSVQNQKANAVMQKFSENIKIETYIQNLSQEPTSSTAILCRSNGEAIYASSLLCKKKIRHTLNKGAQSVQPLPRWIADVFWDDCREIMSKPEFLDRFRFRCNSEQDSLQLWNMLCSLSGNDEENVQEINLDALKNALANLRDYPKELDADETNLTVSTIHRAKGREFDRVILLASKIDLKENQDSAEEARVRYVALTRPKQQFVVMKMESPKKVFQKTKSNRFIEVGFQKIKNYYKLYKAKRFCKSIAIGMTGDINCNAFVSGNFAEVIDLQEYISSQVHLYDKLSARRFEWSDTYQIFHGEKCIGALSKQFLQALEDGVHATDYYRNLPNCLENLYVSGITTEILKQYSEEIPEEFQKSRICYGVQVTGLAHLNFKGEEK